MIMMKKNHIPFVGKFESTKQLNDVMFIHSSSSSIVLFVILSVVGPHQKNSLKIDYCTKHNDDDDDLIISMARRKHH